MICALVIVAFVLISGPSNCDASSISLLLSALSYAPSSTAPVSPSSSSSSWMGNETAEFYHYQPDAIAVSQEQVHEAMGRSALAFTNEFRVHNGLNVLEWSSPLAQIGWIHSRDMGQGVSNFSHYGFDARVANYPNGYNGAGENLYMARGYQTSLIAKNAVDSWIKSPGHRANLLGEWQQCGIGAFENSQGAFYLTQLFKYDDPK